MGTLYHQSLIPSLSWAYTAGARYLEPPVYGSLTLGGYDSARLNADTGNITVPFGADISRDLLVTLDSIQYDTVGSSPLLAGGISIFINSLVPEMWLPMDVCQAFEQAFGLSWNDTSEMCILDEGTHDALVAQHPSFTFTFSESSSSATLDVVFPYAAFDLVAQLSLVNSSTRYFPLQRAQNETQYTLGRVFLQEAYGISDYDRREFRLGQANFPSTADALDLVAIYLPGTKDEESEPAAASERTAANGLSGGSIAGVVIGVLAAVLLVVCWVLWYVRRRRQTRNVGRDHALDEIAEKPSSDASGAPQSELTGLGTA